MTKQRWNCLSEGQTIAEIVRREHVEGVDIRWCKSVAAYADDRNIETCPLPEAEFGTIYAMTDLGEAIAIHDFDFDAKGRAESMECWTEIIDAILAEKSRLAGLAKSA